MIGVTARRDGVQDHFYEFGFETTDPIQNLQFIFLFMIGLLIFPFLIKFLELLFCYCNRITYRILVFKQEFVYYNIYLRFMIEAYLEVALVSLLRIKSFNFMTTGDGALTLFAFVKFTVLALMIPLTALHLRSNHDDIRKTHFVNKYGALVLGLQHREISAMY